MTEEQIDNLFAAMSGLDHKVELMASSLDHKIESVASKVELIANNVSSLDQKVTILQEHVVTEVATSQQVNSVYDLLDKNISEHERQEQERAAMAHQIDRLTKWAESVAAKTGVPLPY